MDRNPPVVDFQANKTDISEGDKVMFECKSQGIPTSWEWTFPGGIPNFSSEKNPVITYDKAGTYQVILTVRNEFGVDTKVIEEYISVRKNEISENQKIEIKTFPNPAVNRISIEISDNEEPVTVFIIGSLGNIYKEFQIEQMNQSVDISYFPRGIYYAVANRNGITSSCKFLKN